MRRSSSMTASQNPPFLSFRKEALAVTPRQATAQCRRLGDGEDRRMRIGSVRDPERVEAPKQLFGGQRRRRHCAAHDAGHWPPTQALQSRPPRLR